MERSIAVKKWEEDHLVGNAGCDRVMKLDGINSFKSGSGKLSMNFKKSSVKAKDGNPMHGRNERLAKAVIEKLKKYYGEAISNNVKREVTNTEERDQAVQSMKTEILVGFFHCLKLPYEERHQSCPANSWCKLKKGLPCPNKPHHLDMEHLVKIYERVTDSALLARCLPGYTQNAYEPINPPRMEQMSHTQVARKKESAVGCFISCLTFQWQCLRKSMLS